MKHVPNFLSFIRLALCPVFVWAYFYRAPDSAFVIFMFASLLDILDGFIARKFNCISVLGKIIDPVADKVLQLCAIICFSLSGIIGWFVPLILGLKELTVLLGGAIISKKRNDMVYSNKFGKFASFLTSFSLCTLFFIESFLFPYKTALYFLLYLAIFLSVIAMIQYGLIGVFGLNSQAETKEKKAK